MSSSKDEMYFAFDFSIQILPALHLPTFVSVAKYLMVK